MAGKNAPGSAPPPVDSLLETLQLLSAQVQLYERVLPADNYPARAALAVIGDLARRALSEAQTVAEALAAAMPGDSALSSHPFSTRERQVLNLAARGLTNKEIAYRLLISERTVQFHMNSIFNKTGTSTRTEAVALAVWQKWVDLDVDEI